MLRAVVGDAVADHKVAVPRCAARPPAPRCASATLPSKSFPVCEQTSPALRSRGKPGEPAVIPECPLGNASPALLLPVPLCSKANSETSRKQTKPNNPNN
ncbi:hypothetical protein H671_3g9152 [Cricetulus griseus]|nr:hypothetical protein H671_3g9152 [Cricetulus griseus]